MECGILFHLYEFLRRRVIQSERLSFVVVLHFYLIFPFDPPLEGVLIRYLCSLFVSAPQMSCPFCSPIYKLDFPGELETVGVWTFLFFRGRRFFPVTPHVHCKVPPPIRCS